MTEEDAELEVLRDELIEHARRYTEGDPLGAVSALVTAGFAVLCDVVSNEHAVGAMRKIVNAAAARVTH